MESVESLSQLIRARRTCYNFENKQIAPVTDEMVERCLEAAIWAPNHKLTEPWRFWELSEATQTQFSTLYAQLRADKRAEAGTENHRAIFDSAIEKFNAIPKVIFVGQQLAKDALTQKEDYAACACAIQNFQLMAWRLNMGVQWSTGPIIQHPDTYQALGISSAEVELIGVLFVGQLKGDCSTQNGRRKPLSEVRTKI